VPGVRSQAQEKNWSDGVLDNGTTGKTVSKSRLHYPNPIIPSVFSVVKFFSLP